MTLRLTAECSTAELQGNGEKGYIISPYPLQAQQKNCAGSIALGKKGRYNPVIRLCEHVHKVRNDESKMPRPATETLPTPEAKHDYVEAMFDAIAPRYDLLNSVLSLRLHGAWRRAAAQQTGLKAGDKALDVCTGTGDFACELARWVGPTGSVVGTDFARKMLRWGEPKLAEHPNVSLQWADTQALPFPDASFDAVTVAFGIRNVADIERGLTEMSRVTKPGGRVVILEFNRPKNPVVAWGYGIYQKLMPLIGGLISGRRSAYAYLPASIDAFHSREALAGLMKTAGLSEIRVTDLNFGTVVIHQGINK